MTRQLIYPEGSWVALITPFDKKGNLDIDGFKKLVDFQVSGGTNGLLLMGSTGEPTGLALKNAGPSSRRWLHTAWGKSRPFSV